MNDFTVEYINYKEVLEKELTKYFDINIQNTLLESMKYSTLNGGKRLRGILCIAANKLFCGDINEILPIACALEMIHAYSLIHDDLPSMDNDVLRRGLPSNHIKFGEANAILAGDGLQAYAFQIMTNNALKYQNNALNHIKAINIIAKYSGIFGMIMGQSLDIMYENETIDFERLKEIHENKTGKLIKASLLSGAYVCNPDNKEIDAIEKYGENIGIAFQIIDDVLDVTGDSKTLGKSIGKDDETNKQTYVKFFGIEKSIEIAKEHIEKAKDSIALFENKNRFLINICDSILERKS